MGNMCGAEKDEGRDRVIEKRGSISTIQHPAAARGIRASPTAAQSSVPVVPTSSAPSSRPVTQPNSHGGTNPPTPPHAQGLPLTDPLPTIPTIKSPYNGRAISAHKDPYSADSPTTEDAPIALDIRVDSGGDAAESFWHRVANREDNKRTYRQVEKAGARNGRLGQTIKATMRATLGGGDIMVSVQLPPGEDQNEWIAVNSQHQQHHHTPLMQNCTFAHQASESSAVALTLGTDRTVVFSSPLFRVRSHSFLQRRFFDLGHLQ